LRKLNLLRLESLHVLQDECEVSLAEARYWELAFLHPETLARLHGQVLTPERYAIIRQRQEGKYFALHLVFADLVCVYLFGKLMLTSDGKSVYSEK
jgi:hypothetical protein